MINLTGFNYLNKSKFCNWYYLICSWRYYVVNLGKYYTI
jgi:hypothetical protein